MLVPSCPEQIGTVLSTIILKLASFPGTITISHGRVTSARVTINDVEGVAVLSLGGTAITSQFFDCHTSNGLPSNLMWTKEEGTQRFPSRVVGPFERDGVFRTVLRLDLAPPSRPVGHADTGVYVCTDITSSNPVQSVSINITGGELV